MRSATCLLRNCNLLCYSWWKSMLGHTLSPRNPHPVLQTLNVPVLKTARVLHFGEIYEHAGFSLYCFLVYCEWFVILPEKLPCPGGTSMLKHTNALLPHLMLLLNPIGTYSDFVAAWENGSLRAICAKFIFYASCFSDNIFTIW